MTNFIFKCLLLLCFCVLVLISGAYAFWGWRVYDDEGLFLRIAYQTLQGHLPYRDVPLEYGPLFIWINNLFFSLYGVSHFASRVGTLALALATGVGLFVVSEKYFSSRLVCIVPAVGWFTAAAWFFSESLHPGRYIALLLVLQGIVIFSKLPDRYRYVCQGVLTGLIAGFKPHLGVLSASVLFTLAILQGRKWRWLALIGPFGLFLLWISSFQWMSPRLTTNQVDVLLGILPYGLAAILPVLMVAYELRRRTYVSQSEHRFLGMWFLFSMLFTVALIYSFAFARYGFFNMKLWMFDVPGERYPPLVFRFYHFTSVQAVACLLGFSSILLLGRVSFQKKLATIGICIVLILLMKLGRPTIIVAWPLVYLLTWIKIRSRGEHDSKTMFGVLLLSCAHFFHTYPVAGSQIDFATPLGWFLLTANLFPNDINDKSLLAVKRYSLPFAIVMATMINVVFFERAQSVFEGKSSTLSGMGFIELADKEEKIFVELVNYIDRNSPKNRKVLTLPIFDSLLFWSNSSNPTPVVGVAWVYFPDFIQKSIVEALPNVPFVVLNTNSPRYQWEKSTSVPPGWSTDVLNAIEQDYKEIPPADWTSDGNAGGYQLLSRRDRFLP